MDRFSQKQSTCCGDKFFELPEEETLFKVCIPETNFHEISIQTYDFCFRRFRLNKKGFNR